MSKILVVEDEQNIRETLVEILELSGYEVFSSNNGKEGYEQILKVHPDLVLCDVNMPELDGFSLLEAISNRLSNEVMPAFLFLTARVGTSEIRHGMNLGADDYILKPFEHTEVLQIIKLRLQKREKMLGTLVGRTIPPAPKFDKLSIPTEEGLELVPFEHIMMCKAERAYCTFYLSKGRKILVSKPMGEFEEVLLNKGFLKVHKSSIVNIDYAEKYVRGKGGFLVLSDGTQVIVSTRKKEELMKVLKYK